MKNIINNFLNRKRNEKEFIKSINAFTEDMLLYVEDLDSKYKIEGIEIKTNELSVVDTEINIRHNNFTLKIYDYDNVTLFEMFENNKTIFTFESSFGKNEEGDLVQDLKIKDENKVNASIQNINEKINKQNKLKIKDNKKNSYRI